MHYTVINTPRSESGLDGCFRSYQTIDGISHEPQVLRVLRRCAYLVGPIMRRRNLIVPLLAELPLDSLNAGTMVARLRTVYSTRKDRHAKTTAKTTSVCMAINLRVRHPDRPHKFLPMKYIVQTLLHELAHVGHPHHNLRFWRCNARLLEELKHDSQDEVKVYRREMPKRFAERHDAKGFMRLLISLAPAMLGLRVD